MMNYRSSPLISAHHNFSKQGRTSPISRNLRFLVAVNTTISSYSAQRSFSKQGTPILRNRVVVSSNDSRRMNTNILNVSVNSSSEVTVMSRPQLQKVLTDARKFGFRNLDDALNLFGEMNVMRPLPLISDYTALLGVVNKMRHYEAVIYMFRTISHLRIPHSIYTMNICMNCFCRLKRVSFGFSVFGSMLKCGLQPDVVTFNTLINGLCSEDKVNEAGHLFRILIEREKCEPDEVMFNTVIKGLCRVRNNESALGLLRIIDKSGYKPDTVTYSTIIDSLCKEGLVKDALTLYSEMIMKGITPDVITYNCLIDGLCKFGHWKQAEEMWKEMRKRNIFPNVFTYNILVDSFCKEGRVDKAKSVVEIMTQIGQAPDAVTYNALMDGYCLRGEMDEATHVFNTMVDHEIAPTVLTYNTLINGYVNMKKINEALHLFNHELPLKGLQPDVKTYTMMIWGLCEEGLPIEAKELFARMKKNGFVPDEFSYSTIVYGLLKLNEKEEAMKFVNEMLRKGFSPSASVVSMIVDMLADDTQGAALVEMIQKLEPKSKNRICELVFEVTHAN